MILTYNEPWLIVEDVMRIIHKLEEEEKLPNHIDKVKIVVKSIYRVQKNECKNRVAGRYVFRMSGHRSNFKDYFVSWSNAGQFAPCQLNAFDEWLRMVHNDLLLDDYIVSLEIRGEITSGSGCRYALTHGCLLKLEELPQVADCTEETITEPDGEASRKSVDEFSC